MVRDGDVVGGHDAADLVLVEGTQQFHIGADLGVQQIHQGLPLALFQLAQHLHHVGWLHLGKYIDLFPDAQLLYIFCKMIGVFQDPCQGF